MERAHFSFGFRTGTGCLLGLLLALAWTSIGDALASTRQASAGPDSARVETGVASYYSTRFHGRQTANGEIFDMHQLTAAHPRLAFGTRVKVTRVENNRSVTVRINDRGPF